MLDLSRSRRTLITNDTKTKPGLPPGPRSRLFSTIRQGLDPSSALIDWSERYGATFTVRDVTGTTVVTGDQELIKEIFSAGPEVFDNTPETFDVIFGPNSLPFKKGADHLLMRKLMAPAMARGASSRWASPIAELARASFDDLEAGTELHLLAPLAELSMRIIARVVHGAQTPVEEERLIRAGLEVIGAAHPSFILTRQTQRELGGLSPYYRYRVARDAWDTLIYPQIERARADQAERFDILAMFARMRYADGASMDDAELRDNMLMLMMAGQETLASTAAWMLYFIHRDPEVHSRVLVELDDTREAASPELPYLNAVFDETLRLRPPGPQTFRRLLVPWRLGPWELPAGVTVSPAIILVHTNPQLWDQPELFRPERFLGSRPGPFQYLPFGGGHFRCLGAALAKSAVLGMVATLLRRHELELLTTEPVPVARIGFTMGPGADIGLRVLGRPEQAIERSRADLRSLASGASKPFANRRLQDSLIDMKIFTSAASHATMRVVRVPGAEVSRQSGVFAPLDIDGTGPLEFDLVAGVPSEIAIDDSGVRPMIKDE